MDTLLIVGSTPVMVSSFVHVLILLLLIALILNNLF